MRNFATAAIALALLIPAEAGATSELRFNLVAEIGVYCRISQAQTPVIAIRNGSADIGPINEICNTPNGYDVHTQFTNLSGGALNVAGVNYPIDATGMTVRRSDHAAVQTQNWRVADARVTAPGQDVVMRVMISPR